MHKLTGINLKTYRSTKEMQRQQKRSIPTDFSKKKVFTKDEKELLTKKIQDAHDENISKSFAGKANPVHLTLTAIGLIVLFFLYIVWMLSDPSMSPGMSKILDILLGGIITLAFLGMLSAGILGCFFLFTRLLKRSPKLKKFPNPHHFPAGSSNTVPKEHEINNQM